MKKSIYLLLACTFVIMVSAPTSHAVDFSGKTITWIIPFKTQITDFSKS